MPSDVESKLRDVGRHWNTTIPHVDVDEILGRSASSADRPDTAEAAPTATTPRFRWAVGAAALLLLAMVGALAVFARTPGTGTSDATPSSQLPDVVTLPALTGIPTAEATVIGSPTADGERFEIDLGATDGLRVGMPVVDASGLVGKIATVGDTTSIVLPVSHPDFSIEAIAASGPDGATQTIFPIRGSGGSTIVSEPTIAIDLSDIRLGDPVATAGGSQSVAPPDIPIGVVSSLRRDDAQIVVDPVARGATPTTVQVVLFFPLPDNASPTTSHPAPVDNEFDDPQLRALADTALGAAEWNLAALEGQIGTTEAFSASVSGDVDTGRVTFEIEAVPNAGTCRPAGWQQDFSGTDEPGTPTAEGMLYLDEAEDGPVRSATVVSDAAVVNVRADGVPLERLPDVEAFADTARAIVADLPFILAGGERPRFYVVRCGDLLDLIASRFDTPVDDFVVLNGLSDENDIFAGMTLEVPPVSSPDDAGSVSPAGGIVFVMNANTVGGSAGRLTDRLEYAGFEVTDPANAAMANRTDSVLYVREGHACLGDQLAELLGIEAIEPMPEILPVDDPDDHGEPVAAIVLGDDLAQGFDLLASTIVCDESID